MKKHKLTISGFAIIFVFLWICFPRLTAVYPQSAEEAKNEKFKNAETAADYEQFIEEYKPDELAFVAIQIFMFVQKQTAVGLKQLIWEK